MRINNNNFLSFGNNFSTFFFYFFQTAGGEMKSKPTQMSVRELRGCGFTPDIVRKLNFLMSN